MLAAALLAGCALAPYEPDSVPLPDVAHFSTVREGAALPGGWRNWTFSRFKRPTDYQLVSNDGRMVIRATIR